MLWLVKGLGRGGAEQLLVEHARVADHDTMDLHVAFVTPGKDQLVGDLEAAGATVHDLTGAGWRWPLAQSRLVRRLDPDVVHVHSPLLAVVERLRRLGRRHRSALVYTEHNRWLQYRWPTRVANALTHRLDDHQFAVSAEIVATVSAGRRRHMEVLHHGIDVAAVAAHTGAGVRAELGIDDGQLLVVTVANCRPEKDLGTLLRAAAHVLAARDDVTFVHAGTGPTEAALHTLRDELGLDHDRCRLLGRRADAVDLIAAADVFCLSSRHEGLPVTVMEALAVGTPVVATAVGGIPEAVTDGTEGQLVPPGDPLALATALGHLLDDADRRAAAAVAARDRAEAFDVRRSARRVEAVYAGLVTDPGPTDS